ncbi:hypothetical protein [Hymenobacter sp. BT491]|uniref:hypothetical protein n=1 Tax=Hymenobacter sp. BT491 TaxID=2766779 RepID=UPI001653E42D|nr:hypothetical protein [Hymenobacter sp. BT491]MBC6988993.1 hypothetical protein [Hymenobacter sp. BT491]
MANKKVLRRDEYDAEIDRIAPFLPSNYAGIICHYRPDLDKRRIWNARHKKAVDFDILSELKRVARESAAAKQLVTA